MKVRMLSLIVGVSLIGLAGITSVDMAQQNQAGTMARLRVPQLSETDAANILYMWQEEKLARDVYLALYEEWDAAIFSNISQAEQQHMDALKKLMDLYGLQEPTNSIGFFDDPEFAELYVTYVNAGDESLLSALNVGVLIEELDIADLNEKLAQTEMRNVRRVFENLLAGSIRHLAAFEQCIDNYDEDQQTCLNCGTCIQARDRDGTCINQ
jgi:hypothetical protein